MLNSILKFPTSHRIFSSTVLLGTMLNLDMLCFMLYLAPLNILRNSSPVNDMKRLENFVRPGEEDLPARPVAD
jgi:uncharacterized metal-binding protein